MLAPFGVSLAFAQGRPWRGVLIVVGFSLPLLIPYDDADVIPEPNANAVYNRFATAALFLIIAALALPKRLSRSASAWLAGVLLLLLFTKISAFAIAVLLLVTFVVSEPVSRP